MAAHAGHCCGARRDPGADAANADVEPINLTTSGASPATPGASTSTGPLADDPSTLLAQWHPSVVALWTATTRTSGFVVDANGWIATSQRGVGTATSVEVQITPSVKVAAQVLVADSVHEVAVLRVDPKVVASVRPVPLRCEQASDGDYRERTGNLHDRRAAPSAERPQRRDSARGREERVHGRLQSRSWRHGRPRLHGGRQRGRSQLQDDVDGRRREDSRVIGLDHVCGGGICEEDEGCRGTQRHTPLPVEPERPFPLDAIKDEKRHFTGGLNPYQLSSSGFDVTFITPVLIHGGQNYSAQASRRDGGAAPDAGSRADRHAAAPGLQQLVRLRGGGAAGIARPRDPEAGGGLPG